MEQCIALTQKGTQCKRNAKEGSFCYQHNWKNKTLSIEPTHPNKISIETINSNKISNNTSSTHPNKKSIETINSNNTLSTHPNKILNNTLEPTKVIQIYTSGIIFPSNSKDIIYMILDMISIDDILNLMLVNKEYKEICYDEKYWKIKYNKLLDNNIVPTSYRNEVLICYSVKTPYEKLESKLNIKFDQLAKDKFKDIFIIFIKDIKLLSKESYENIVNNIFIFEIKNITRIIVEKIVYNHFYRWIKDLKKLLDIDTITTFYIYWYMNFIKPIASGKFLEHLSLHEINIPFDHITNYYYDIDIYGHEIETNELTLPNSNVNLFEFDLKKDFDSLTDYFKGLILVDICLKEKFNYGERDNIARNIMDIRDIYFSCPDGEDKCRACGIISLKMQVWSIIIEHSPKHETFDDFLEGLKFLTEKFSGLNLF